MLSHLMYRPAPISVASDQRRTKSTIWSRTSCGTQTPVRAPQDFFLKPRAPPSARPGPHPWSGFSSPDTRCVPVRPGGWVCFSVGRPPTRSRKTPSANGTTRSVAALARHTATRPAPSPTNAASGWQLSLLRCSASLFFSSVLSVILTVERPLHFQQRRNTDSTGFRKFQIGNPLQLGLDLWPFQRILDGASGGAPKSTV